MVNTILKEADLFCPNSVRINFTIYLLTSNRPNIFLWIDAVDHRFLAVYNSLPIGSPDYAQFHTVFEWH
ncbi:Aspartate aminotransferase [Levilactobacillus zymae]|uniref:Aspartate aminotransferase n=1 Tax=Levilactobacillus zymae TaxID=267363 RepID=A0A1Y6JYE1_9LACO|nr:Aspartate aminotransferase [Levilactobacillus zymae]